MSHGMLPPDINYTHRLLAMPCFLPRYAWRPLCSLVLLLSPFRVRPWRRCFLLSALCLLLWPAFAIAAEPIFPRGPGFYFNPFKLVALLIVFLCWMRTCSWVDEDAKRLRLPQSTWNTVLWGSGLLGLAIVWLLPWFWLSFAVLLGLYLGSSISYVVQHNRQVPDVDKVLTQRYFQVLTARWFHVQLRPSADKSKKTALRFLSASGVSAQDSSSAEINLEGTRGYKSALQMVNEAIHARATEIHLEPSGEEMTVCYQIDGVIRPSESFTRSMGDVVIHLFKLLADLDVKEKRKPQDGRFWAALGHRKIDLCITTAGSVAGEKLTLRIVDKAKQLHDLGQLGMSDSMREQVRTIVQRPKGMLIVCGPRGAGRTTTLYACLNEIDRYQKNVASIENPIEYRMANMTQREVDLKAGRTFAAELRHSLREYPDVIMVGDMGDQETAQIACQAATKGPLIITALDTGDAAGAMLRLIDLGVPPAAVANAVSGVISQRLVRLLCPKCKIRYRPNPDMLRKANLPADRIKYFYRPSEDSDHRQGPSGQDEEETCATCDGNGYRGRTGIFELLVPNDAIRQLIAENPNANAIKQEAIKNGMTYLQEDGLRKVIEGKTSIQELLRVCK